MSNTEDFDASMIDQIAAQQMGVAPQQPAPQQQQPAPQQSSQQPTPQEQATSKLAPKTESAAAKEDPFEFFDAGNGQVYTPDQLRGINSPIS